MWNGDSTLVLSMIKGFRKRQKKSDLDDLNLIYPPSENGSQRKYIRLQLLETFYLVLYVL